MSFLHCKSFVQNVCQLLWCATSDQELDGCRTQNMPWADGTPCTIVGNPDEHWCQRRECVPRNQSLAKVDGGWGAWSQYAECSRSCGGGVTSIKRDCNSPTPVNGGKYCVGQRIRYESCNTQACPPGEADFREQQCSAFNGNSFDLGGLPDDVRWVPKYGGECVVYLNRFSTRSDDRLYYSLSHRRVQTVLSRHQLQSLLSGVRPSDRWHPMHTGDVQQVFERRLSAGWLRQSAVLKEAARQVRRVQW